VEELDLSELGMGLVLDVLGNHGILVGGDHEEDLGRGLVKAGEEGDIAEYAGDGNAGVNAGGLEIRKGQGLRRGVLEKIGEENQVVSRPVTHRGVLMANDPENVGEFLQEKIEVCRSSGPVGYSGRQRVVVIAVQKEGDGKVVGICARQEGSGVIHLLVPLDGGVDRGKVPSKVAAHPKLETLENVLVKREKIGRKRVARRRRGRQGSVGTLEMPAPAVHTAFFLVFGHTGVDALIREEG